MWPAGPAEPSSTAHLINRFQVQVPTPAPAMGLVLGDVQFKADGKGADTGTVFIKHLERVA